MEFRRYFTVITAFFGLFATGAFASQKETDCISQSSTIEEKLACIEDMTFTEVRNDPSTPAGMRQFDLRFTQPLDHYNRLSSTFTQRVVLLHRDEAEPMVLQTSGYSIFAVKQSLLAATFATNQIQVEHRFFSSSTPAELDWSKLDIRQSAEDFHHITVELKQIYQKHWVNTGGSKGGMTSVYHHRFFPDDLDGTIADVAPLSFSTSDERYITWVENVGGDEFKDCRAKFQDLQIKLLEHRDELTPQINGTFEQLGSSDMAFEHAVIESSFIFWQYSHPDDPEVGCDKIPVNGTSQQMFDYLDAINPLSGYDDSGLEGFMSYYFQAATQLGNPGSSTAHLERLRRFPFNIDQYTPKGVSYSYSNEEMLSVENWVKTDAHKIIFVYGEFDPWSSGAFPVGAEGSETYKYWVKHGNHGSKFNALEESQKQEVLATLARWFDKQPVKLDSKKGKVEYLEDLEFKALKLRHL